MHFSFFFFINFLFDQYIQKILYISNIIFAYFLLIELNLIKIYKDNKLFYIRFSYLLKASNIIIEKLADLMGNCGDSNDSKDPVKITPITSLNQQPSINQLQLSRRRLLLPPIVKSQGKGNSQPEKQKANVKVKVRKLNGNNKQEDGNNNDKQQFQQVELKLKSKIYRNDPISLLKKFNTNQKQLKRNTQIRLKEIQKRQSLLHMIKKDILTNPALTSVLSTTFFQKLNNLLVNQSWSYDYLTLITKLLLDYVKFSARQLSNQSKSQTLIEMNKFCQIFSKQLNRLYKQVKMRNSRLILSYQYYDTFKEKDFTLSRTQSLQQIFDQISSFSFDSKAYLPFISTYLIKGCMNLENNNVNMQEINKRLSKFIKYVQTKYSFMKNQAIQEQKQKMISLYQKQLQQINQLQPQRQEITNKVYIFKSKDKSLKQQELSIVINNLREQAKKYFSVFTEFTAKGCFENQGFGFQTHLKFKNHEDYFAQLSTKEQFCHLHSKQIQKTIPNSCKTIQDLRQIDYKIVKAALIYGYSNQPQIQLVYNDLLYGKCSFNNIKDIKETVKSFKRNSRGIPEKDQYIKLVQIQNKLIQQGKLQLRFKIGQINCKFKLYLRSFEALNEICEGMQQITNSKLFSPTTLLLQWHQRLCNNYFTYFQQIDKDSKKQQYIRKMKKLFKFEMQIDSRLQIQLQNQKYYQKYLKIKQKINKLKVEKRACQRVQIRSAKCFTQLKFYRQALQELRYFLDTDDLQWMFLVSQAYKNCSLILHAIRHYQTFIIEASVRSLQNDQNIQIASKSLSQCYIDNGHYQKGLQLAQKLLLKHSQKHSIMSLQYAEILVIIGRALTLLGKPKEALKKYQRSINIFDQLKAKNNPSYMKVFYGLAQIYAIQGRTAEVYKTFLQVVALQEQIYGQSLQAAEIMTEIGIIYMTMSDLKQSQFYIKLSIQMIESLVGRNSIQFYYSLIPLSNLYKNISRFDAAEQLIKMCRGVIVDQIGHVCYENGVLYLHLGSIARGKNEISNAIKHLRQSLNIFEQVQEQDAMNFLIFKELIYCYKWNKDKENLLKCFNQASKFVTRIYGQNSLQTAQIQTLLAQIFIQNRMYAECQQACLQIIRKFQGFQIDFHQDYLKILKILVQIYIKAQKVDEVNLFLKKIIQIYERNLVKNIDYGNLCNLYGNFCLQQNKQQEAKQWFKKSLAVYNKFNHSSGSIIQSYLTQLFPKKVNSPLKSPC